LPVAGTFKCPVGWPRNAMAIYTGLLACAGVIAISLLTLSEQRLNNLQNDPVALTIGLVIIGSLGSSWIVNILIMRRYRR
jgi:hypothetical protein